MIHSGLLLLGFISLIVIVILFCKIWTSFDVYFRQGIKLLIFPVAILINLIIIGLIAYNIIIAFKTYW